MAFASKLSNSVKRFQKDLMTGVRRVEQATAVRAIRSGLINMIPVLIIGAFALVITSFPVKGYQEAIKTFAGGFFLDLFTLINKATFGVLSLYMTFSISRSYMKIKADPESVHGGAIVAALLSFFILAGANLESFGTDSMGPKSMFLAILTGLGASALYLLIDRFFRSRRHYLYARGVDREFNRMLSTLVPIALVAFLFGLFNVAVTRIFTVDSFRSLLALAFNKLFSHGANGFGKGFCFVLLSSVLWFFGIHGSDTLEGVMQTYFSEKLAEANKLAVAAGEAPTILTKQFFDCFVLMGGCGTTICLLIAILIFSRNRARRSLGYTAAFPMIFNINELMVFGLPIIFNPIMLIPFLTVPLVCYSTAYLATYLGWVPVITESVEWTTPIILGGLHGTGSAAGALLQVINVLLGVLIYLPFVRLLDRQSDARDREHYAAFMKYFKENEQELVGVRMTELSDIYGDFAKGLCAEMRHGMAKQIRLAYQPQYSHDGHCIGVEALLRWQHPTHGMLYPPLVIKLAEEAGLLPDLEETIFLRALSDRPAILKEYGEEAKISINITGTTIVTPRFLAFCRAQNEADPFKGRNICIEITEQATLSLGEETRAALLELRQMGLLLAIDDFSMGQTSLHYLKDNMFDIIKLDGSLVQGLFVHQNCREIISSIAQLAASLDLSVIAEYVETAEQRSVLHEIGCDIYQGYLYSPAVFLSENK